MQPYISKFNPSDMSDDVVLSLATGRKQLLHEVLDTLEDNNNSESACQHLLIWGPRGMGKSFFLKYLRINFEADERFKNCRFISLPEEQSNIVFASDLIRMILSQLTGKGFVEVTSYWTEPEGAWDKAYKELLTYIDAQKVQFGKYLLVVVVENLEELFKQFDDIDQGRIRQMLERLTSFTLIGANPQADVDSDYNQRIFHVFKQMRLQAWKEEDYLAYFERRFRLDIERQGLPFDTQRFNILKAKLKAISQFTGGSPRMAVVLSNLLLKDDVISTAKTLYGLIDDLTPYYQDLTKTIPKRSKILFDALIRHKENLSQSELAEKIGTHQNQISRAFYWLVVNGYLLGAKRQDSKHFRYYVADRVYVLYYFRREVYHDKDYTPIWLMADFLTVFYQKEELRERALRFLLEKPSHAKSFAAANKILSSLKDHADKVYTQEFLNNFFGGLIKEGIKNDLLRDISDEAMRLFSEPHHRIIPEAALHVAQYVASGKSLAYLEKLHPDMAITVESIVKEADL